MIIRKANAAGKPVITATQMLESMIENPRPTRAEASDVANAILDGTDAVMLSAETAVGKFPIEAVTMMARIAEVTESRVSYRARMREEQTTLADAIGNAACEIAKQLNANLILALTSSGYSARMISRHRPQTPICAITSNERTRNRLALVWGIKCSLLASGATSEAIIESSLDAILAQGIAARGDRVVIVGGVPAGIAGKTNMIQVRVVGEKSK
jgi:pyruvate kinase